MLESMTGHLKEHLWGGQALLSSWLFWLLGCKLLPTLSKDLYGMTPDTQFVMKTNTSDYALAAILFIMTKDNEIHPIAFYS